MGKAVIVGGGISGLSAAYEFVRRGWQIEVHEASNRWGGKIWSSPVGDRLVDAGPDAILARAEAGIGLCRELGLDDEITHPIAAKPAYLFIDDTLHLLPAGTVLGVPVDLSVLDQTDLITDHGRRQAARDLELPPPDLNNDMPLGRLCRERLGNELTDRLIDPLIGGINASDIDQLSLRAAAPLLAKAVSDHGSLIRGIAALYPNIGATLGSQQPVPEASSKSKPVGTRAPVFFSLQAGIARLIERLVQELPENALHLNSPIEHVRQLDPEADAIVVAVPAGAGARLLADVTPATKHLDGINYAGVSQVTVALPGQTPLDAAGILFPRVGGTVLTASTWLSSKWPHYQQSDVALVRLTSGRFGDDRAARLDDETLTSTLLAELNGAFPIEVEPLATRVHRWPRALPQYEPGHLERVAEVRAELTAADRRIRLVGAAYDGIGIPACIAAARQAAVSLIES
jgi:oxygen-dependent protoporphyrinogen oxidase